MTSPSSAFHAMRSPPAKIKRIPRVGVAVAAALSLVLALGLTVGVRANIAGSGRVPPAALSLAAPTAPGPDAADLGEDAPQPGDVESMSHAERIALFAKRLTVFRLLHRPPPAPLRRHGVAVVRSPIVRGANDRDCLTQAVYYEARGEPEVGQVAVAQVVMNRSRAGGRYPASLCGVVFQGASHAGCQFSFACEGDRQGGPIDRTAWARAAAVADKVMSGAATGDLRATNYHTPAVAPLWDRSIARLAQIGRHIFFGGRDPIPAPSAPVVPQMIQTADPAPASPAAVSSAATAG